MSIDYKYNIKRQVASLLDDKDTFIKAVLQKGDITITTFYKYWNLKKTDRQSAPVDFMKIVSDELGCTIDELIN